jgi:hypothetical protein
MRRFLFPNISPSNSFILNDALKNKFNFGSFWANGFPILYGIQTEILDIFKNGSWCGNNSYVLKNTDTYNYKKKLLTFFPRGIHPLKKYIKKYSVPSTVAICTVFGFCFKGFIEPQ